MNLFDQRNGFQELLQTGKFSDLTLHHVASGKTWNVHRVILAHHSEFFRALLQSDCKETNSSRIELHYEDPERLFGEVLTFLYGGEIVFRPRDVMAYLCLADHYLIEELRLLCTRHLTAVISADNVADVLRQAVRLHKADSIIDTCVAIVAQNFIYLHHQDFSFLPLPVFLRVLRHKYLSVKAEITVYAAVSAYIDAHAARLQREDVAALMESVRFVWMDYAELERMQQDPRVPPHLLIEALLHRIKLQEDPLQAKLLLGADGQPNPRLQKRMRYGMRFEPKAGARDCGILFFIGTEGRLRPEYWINPCLSKEVAVTASSIEKGNLAQLVSRNPGELWTKDVPASWFCIDLGKDRSVIPSHYELRHGRRFKSDCPRTWDLQGSNDGEEWTLLRRHSNDKGIDGPFESHTFALPDVDEAYRFFRVIQTGHNSSNHNFLALSGFELFGDLYEQEALN